MAKHRLSIEEVISRIRTTHGDCVTLDVTTYVTTMNKARFIDKDYGEWWTQVNNVLNGHGHRLRGLAQNRLTCQERYGVEYSWAAAVVKQQIEKTNISRYGVPHVLQNPKILSKNMKSRRRASVHNHWKTNEQLVCVASYEVAFVNWCNFHKIDFDWQISHRMPDERTYVIDAFIKDGNFTNTWIEIKGWLSGPTKEKWEWFHFQHLDDSQLWNNSRLNELTILVGDEPNPLYIKV